MNLDSVMVVVILCGFALCGGYFSAQYRDWRRQQNTKIQEKIRVRLLYLIDLSHPSESGFAQGLAHGPLPARQVTSKRSG